MHTDSPPSGTEVGQPIGYIPEWEIGCQSITETPALSGRVAPLVFVSLRRYSQQ
jgi:hypothetical protein